MVNCRSIIWEDPPACKECVKKLYSIIHCAIMAFRHTCEKRYIGGVLKVRMMFLPVSLILHSKEFLRKGTTIFFLWSHSFLPLFFPLSHVIQWCFFLLFSQQWPVFRFTRYLPSTLFVYTQNIIHFVLYTAFDFPFCFLPTRAIYVNQKFQNGNILFS